MMHVPAARFGKLGTLIVPYIKTLVPAVIAIFGLAALMELSFHVRHASAGDDEMTLFWTTFNSHNALPWIIASVATVGGFWLARLSAPSLKEAWHRANTPKGRPA